MIGQAHTSREILKESDILILPVVLIDLTRMAHMSVPKSVSHYTPYAWRLIQYLYDRTFISSVRHLILTWMFCLYHMYKIVYMAYRQDPCVCMRYRQFVLMWYGKTVLYILSMDNIIFFYTWYRQFFYILYRVIVSMSYIQNNLVYSKYRKIVFVCYRQIVFIRYGRT